MRSLQSHAVLPSVESMLLLTSRPEMPHFCLRDWKLPSNTHSISSLPSFSFDLFQSFLWRQSPEDCFLLLLSSLACLPDPFDGLHDLPFPLSPEIVSFLKSHHLTVPEGSALLSFSASQSTINLSIITPLLLDSFATDTASDPSLSSVLYQALWKLLCSHFSLRSPGSLTRLLSRSSYREGSGGDGSCPRADKRGNQEECVYCGYSSALGSPDRVVV